MIKSNFIFNVLNKLNKHNNLVQKQTTLNLDMNYGVWGFSLLKVVFLLLNTSLREVFGANVNAKLV